MTFDLCQPLVFLRNQDAQNIEKGKQYKMNVLVERDKLIFMEHQNPLCRLYLNAYHVKKLNDNHIQIIYLDFEKQKQENTQKQKK